jgi:hypothetical protein
MMMISDMHRWRNSDTSMENLLGVVAEEDEGEWQLEEEVVVGDSATTVL